ncbi:MAG: hypothetical protein PVSMB4_09230 [Ktedonobacterales bacterium]
MGTIPELEGALQLVLDASAREHGMMSGWQQRRGALSPRQFVQTLVFGFLEDPQATLSHLARVAHALGALVTPQAISQRFSARSVALLQGVLQDALGLLLEAAPVEAPVWQAFPGGVFLDDATHIALHDDWRERWPGSGTAAALKLPTVIDLVHGALQFALVPACHHDTTTALANGPFPVGALVIEDLGYLDLGRMQARHAAGVATLLPLRCTLALTDARGRRVRLLRWLRRHPNTVVERPVWAQGHCLRLVALPASSATATRHRQALTTDARDHGRPPNALALALADWILLLTTATPAQATALHLGVLMRLRWQVELLFKLWKDQGKLDETRGWNPARIATEWYAKLLGLLLQHWLVLATGWQWADRSLVKAGQTIREYARCLCLGWHDPATLAHLCARIAHSIAVAGRIGSHCHQQSAAAYAVKT